jgi:hypothetical protein
MASLAPILVPTLEELASEFDRLLAAHRAAETACAADPQNEAIDAQADASISVLSDTCHAIAQLPAQTFEHVRLKARALDWLVFSDGAEPSYGGDRLTYQLVRALIDGAPS